MSGRLHIEEFLRRDKYQSPAGLQGSNRLLEEKDGGYEGIRTDKEKRRARASCCNVRKLRG